MKGLENIIQTITSSDLTIAMLMLLITLLLKDIIVNLTNGILFYINRDFNVGDKIIFKDKEATIINIGPRYTIISTIENINDKKIEVWWYIRNDNIKKLNLGKKKGEIRWNTD